MIYNISRSGDLPDMCRHVQMCAYFHRNKDFCGLLAVHVLDRDGSDSMQTSYGISTVDDLPYCIVDRDLASPMYVRSFFFLDGIL